MNKMMTWQQHQGQRILSKDDIDVIDCSHCGFKHIIPLPNADELQQFYRETFYTDEKVDYLNSAKNDKAWLTSIYNDRFDSFESLLPADQRNILDIGCGPGYFLATGVQRGFNVTGLEPSPHAAEFAQLGKASWRVRL